MALKYGMLELDGKAAPPRGTKVTVVIRPAPGHAAGGKVAGPPEAK